MSDDGERRRPQRSWSHGRGAKQAPNVKPKLDQKERSSKKEKPVKVRRSRSSDSERGRRRERDRPQGERRRLGRSEENRRRDRHESDHRRRATQPVDEVGDTECAVCFCSYDNVFKTPKLLVCGHTFCLECLARINVSSPELKTLSCPVCRELTNLPHGQDLPRLGNNRDIIGKLPLDMQRTLSVRFQRSKGKLLLKNPPASSPARPHTLTLPKKSHGEQVTAGGDVNLNELEQGTVPATMVDVGRPPNRVRGRMRRCFRSDQCYYAVVATIITITVSLMLVGILAFVIIPNVMINRPPSGNQTTLGSPGSGP